MCFVLSPIFATLFDGCLSAESTQVPSYTCDYNIMPGLSLLYAGLCSLQSLVFCRRVTDAKDVVSLDRYNPEKLG